MRPLVAVPGRLSDHAQGLRTEVVAAGRRYLEALGRAGADGAVLLPSGTGTADASTALARFDGLLLLGGGDVDPLRYADERHETVRGVSSDHDEFELAMLRAALDLGLPVLAVCRGCQLLDVAFGGTLHQHLDDGDDAVVQHRGHLHPVALDRGSRVATAMGTVRPEGWSMHHQAIDRVGNGLVVTGRADDGVVEAIERPDGWVVGVQWHPEDTADVDADQQRLFDAFVAACASPGS
jgi:putative glutamine amidotransferase